MIAVEPPHPPLDDAALELLAQYFGIGFAEKPELWSLLQPVSLAGGQWLFRQDDAGDALYLLVRGRLRAWRDLPAAPGEEDLLLGEIAPGECVGEAGLLTGQPRSAGVRAIRDSVLVRVDRHGLELLATVHWVAVHDGAKELEQAVMAVHAWNSRKQKLMSREHVALAHGRLKEQGWF